jgi:hypothetical protein
VTDFIDSVLLKWVFAHLLKKRNPCIRMAVFFLAPMQVQSQFLGSDGGMGEILPPSCPDKHQ